MEERKNVYLSLHKSFVREGIEYTDRATGEARTFNSATLPKGTVVDGMDYYESFGLFAVLILVQLAATGAAAFRFYYKQRKG